MSATAQPDAPSAPGRAPVVAILAVGAATAAAALVSGRPAATAAPVLLAAVAWAAWSAPPRASAGILAFLLLALDDRRTANGAWSSPLAPLGDLLQLSVRTVIPGAGLPLTGAELAVAGLLALAAWRRGRDGPAPDHVRSGRPLVLVAGLVLAGVAYAVANGLARGGDAERAVWQTRPLVFAMALYLLFEVAFRGPADLPTLARIVVGAATARAALAVWIRHGVLGGSTAAEYATDHGDSMLLSLACAIVLAHLFERRDARRLAAAATLVPFLVLGIFANQRRTAWVQLALALATFLLVGRATAWRRQLGRAALAAAPLLVLYGVAGWHATDPLFKPVRLVRSIIDSDVDRSTWDRQVEDWNLAMSMRERPLAGRGFGHEWTEYVAGDAIDTIFLRYKAQPHNQVLGILLFAGPFAFTAIWAPLSLLVLLGIRAHRRARSPEERTAALAVAAAGVIVAVQFFGDLGPFWPQYAVLLGLSLAAGGKLAAASGALS